MQPGAERKQLLETEAALKRDLDVRLRDWERDSPEDDQVQAQEIRETVVVTSFEEEQSVPLPRLTEHRDRDCDKGDYCVRTLEMEIGSTVIRRVTLRPVSLARMRQLDDMCVHWQTLTFASTLSVAVDGVAVKSLDSKQSQSQSAAAGSGSGSSDRVRFLRPLRDDDDVHHGQEQGELPPSFLLTQRRSQTLCLHPRHQWAPVTT
jgi:hypothetical protein